MHVRHVITKADVGGAQTHLLHLATDQRRRGHVVDVIAGLDGPVAAELRSVGVDVTIEPHLRRIAANPLHDVAAFRSIRRLLRANRPDVVHAHSSKGGVLGRLAARSVGVPSVYTAHGFPFQRGAPRMQRAASWVFEAVGGRVGSAVICLTDAEADLARRARICREDRIWVIANGLPDDAPIRTRRASLPIKLAMVARFAPPKLQAELIDALRALLHVEWTLEFIGDGPDFDAVRRHGERVLGDRVRFLGHRDDVAEVLADVDIALLASRYEGMPIALLESMRAANAIVASDLPGVRVLVGEDAPLGRSTTELVVRIGELIAAPSAIDELGAANRRRFLDRFEIGLVTERVDEVYRSLTASTP